MKGTWQIMAVDYCIIGSRLKQARIKAGLTQQELAEQTNLSVAFSCFY